MSDIKGRRSRAPSDGLQYIGNCGIMNAKEASLLIGILEAAIVLIAIPHTVFTSGSDLVFEVVLLLIFTFGTVCLFYGIRRGQPAFLVPYLIIVALEIILFFITAMVALSTIISEDEELREMIDGLIRDLEVAEAKDASYTQKALYITLLFLILFILRVWSLLIVNRCRCYFRDQSRFHPIAMKYVRHVSEDENQAIP